MGGPVVNQTDTATAAISGANRISAIADTIRSINLLTIRYMTGQIHSRELGHSPWPGCQLGEEGVPLPQGDACIRPTVRPKSFPAGIPRRHALAPSGPST